MELSLGNAAAAHEVLGPLLSRAPMGSPAVASAAPDEIEALLELGRFDDAKAVLAGLDAFARAIGRPRPAAAAARSAALIAATEGDFVTAEDAVARALEAHRKFPDPFELGRTQFIQGIVERRRKRKASAREALTGALERFEGLGARAWAERALAELRRTSVRQSSPGELTPTERQVADLAAGGATNREIAERIFISVKTVEANLSPSSASWASDCARLASRVRDGA